MTTNQHDQDHRLPRLAPVAGLLFDPGNRPTRADLAALAQSCGSFGVVPHDHAAGEAELSGDGLRFECAGLAPAPRLQIARALDAIGLPDGFALADQALVTLAPGAYLGGSAQALPVVRVLGALLLELAALRGLRAIAWLPAGLAMSPAWCGEAVGKWLAGGPFPALALTALTRTEHGFASRGLAFFTGQEFVFAGPQSSARGALRLTDWLVAHGRVESACTAELTGFGTVLVEPDGAGRVIARAV